MVQARDLAIAFLVTAMGLAPAISSAQTPPRSIYPISRRLSPPDPEHSATADSVDLDSSQRNDVGLQGRLDDVINLLGVGYNTFLPGSEGACVNGYIYGPQPTGNNLHFTLQVVSSYEQFKEDTAAEASLSSDFAQFSFNAKTLFSQHNQRDMRDKFILAKAYVTLTPNIYVRSASVIPYFAQYDLSVANEAREFYAKCGDAYVSSIQMGGELLALLKMTEVSNQGESKVHAEISAKGWSTDAEADFDREVTSLSQTAHIEVVVDQIGGKLGLVPASDVASANIAELIQYVKEFPTGVLASGGVPVNFTTTPYAVLVPGVLNASKFNELHDTYARMQANRDLAAQTVTTVAAERALLKAKGVPSSKDNQLDNEIGASIASYSADVAALDSALAKCGRAFWKDSPCAFDDRLANYKPAPPPFVEVVKIDVRGQPAQISIPVHAAVELRGAYCYDGTDSCWRGQNGITGNGVAYIAIDGQVYQGGKVAVNAGNVVIQSHDSDYSDNFGDLYAFIYQW